MARPKNVGLDLDHGHGIGRPQIEKGQFCNVIDIVQRQELVGSTLPLTRGLPLSLTMSPVDFMCNIRPRNNLFINVTE